MMDNWADRMIIEYEDGRKDLGRMKDELNAKNNQLIGDKKTNEIPIETKSMIEQNRQDKSKINSMIGTMSESIEWMKTGREPNTFGGIDKKAAYQRKSIANMDLFQSLDILPEERVISEDEKRAIFNMMIDFSPRERECFLMHNAYMMSYAEISRELGIGRSTVQKYVERAKNKLSCRANVVQCS